MATPSATTRSATTSSCRPVTSSGYETRSGGTLDRIHAAMPEIEVPFLRAPGGYLSAGVNTVAASYDQEPLG